MSGDPTLVDSATLLASCRRDVAMASAKLLDGSRYLNEAVATLWELERRALAAEQAKPKDKTP